MADGREIAGVFGLFLRLGCLAWGGPFAQLAMIRAECVDRLEWVSGERFNRALATYQALPGPEAHEMCIYLGAVRAGRLGGVAAGLGFMLPGVVLMLVLAGVYVRFGVAWWLGAAMAGCGPAVAGLVVRAVFRIGGTAVKTPVAWSAAGVGFVGTVLGAPFGALLLAGGCAGGAEGSKGAWRWVLWSGAVASVVAGVVFADGGWARGRGTAERAGEEASASGVGAGVRGEVVDRSGATGWSLAGAGARGGLLTFGGAYTILAVFERSAVVRPGRSGGAGGAEGAGGGASAPAAQGWMSAAELRDGVALAGVIPAPMVVIGTFVGYVGGGLWGALIVTAGVFAPSFAFTLFGHGVIERLVALRPLHGALDGVTAAVVGMIAATAVGMVAATAVSPLAWGVLSAAVVALFVSGRKWVTPAVVLGGAAVGLVFMR